VDGLTENEVGFISEQDDFLYGDYWKMVSIYTTSLGGPKGCKSVGC